MAEQSVITCPRCGHEASEIMPIDACQFFYECIGCGELLRPKPGDCCVFCSYGSVPCPPVQAEREACRREMLRLILRRDIAMTGRGKEGEDMSSTATTTAPIACTLIPDAFRDRVEWIRKLTATSLRRHRRDDLTLYLTYDPGAAGAVCELVRKEQECCGFLRFDVREDADAVHLTIVAPPEARDAAGELFDHFVRRVE